MASKISADYVGRRIGDNECDEDEVFPLGSLNDDPEWYANTVVAAVGDTTKAKPLDRLMRR